MIRTTRFMGRLVRRSSTLLLALALLPVAAIAGESPLVRWAFWVPPERMSEFADSFDDQIAPVLEQHGFVNARPDERALPDSVFSCVYDVVSRDAFNAQRASVIASDEWQRAIASLGQRFGSLHADGTLEFDAGPYRDPAGSGFTRPLPEPTVTPLGSGRGHWVTFGVPDGLPSLDQEFLFEDRDGAIWISTFGSGLSRWDGEGFTNYTSDDGLTSLAPRHLMQTRSGHLWINFRDVTAVARWDGERFHTYDLLEAGLPPGSWIMNAYEDSRGWIWFATTAGLLRYDGVEFRLFTQEDGLAGRPLHWKSILEDSKGRMWFGTDGGINRWNGKGDVVFETLGPEIPAWHFLEDKKGVIWMAARPHIARIDRDDRWELLTGDGGPIPFKQRDWVQDMLMAPDGAMWFLTGTRLFRHQDGETEEIEIEVGQTRRLFLDDEGIFWITAHDGLRRWDGHSITHYTTRDGLDQDMIKTSLLDRRGNLWLGSLGNLTRFDPHRFVTYTVDDGLSGNTGGIALREASGDLLFFSVDGMTRFDGDRFITWRWEEGFHSTGFGQPGTDDQGRLWMRGREGQMYRVHDDSVTTFGAEDGLQPWWHDAFHHDRKGDIWFGHTLGLTRYDGEIFEHFGAPDGLQDRGEHGTYETGTFVLLSDRPADVIGMAGDERDGLLWIHQAGVHSLHDGARFLPAPFTDQQPGWTVSSALDRDGNLWLATISHGLCRWDGETLTRFTTADGLGHDATRSVFQSADGHLWIGTDGGVVSRWDGRVFQTLSRDDGLNGQSIRSITQADNGDLWFVTYGGVTRYRPNPPSPPQIIVDDVVAGRRFTKPSQVTTPSSAALVQISYHGRSLNTPIRGLVYTYRLRGYDDRWRQTRDRRVEFQRLDPGRYVFEIQAVDRDLVYSDTTRVILDVVFEPTLTSVSIDSVQVDELFASALPEYAERAFGSVWVTNNEPDVMDAVVSFQLGRWAQPPGRPVALAPGETRRVDLVAALDEAALELQAATRLPSSVAVSFVVAGDTISRQRSFDVTVHEPGAVRWSDGIGRAASFITPTAPGVADFAGELLRSFAAETKRHGDPGLNLIKALVVFEGLKAHGVRYLDDPRRPYSEGRSAGIDHIQYPAQTLSRRTGDCDDLTVLFASLLESVGVATALVDFPEHLFLMVDAGVSRWDSYRLPVAERLKVTIGDRVWIPVEITRIDDNFTAAWHAGADEISQLSGIELRRRVITTASAWERFYPVVPPLSAPASPTREQVERGTLDGLAALSEAIDGEIDARYLQPMQREPGNSALRTRLLQVYVALTDHDAAIKAGLDHLIDEHGDEAATHNHLGIAYFLKGETRQATIHFLRAVELRPGNEGFERNLQQAKWALGRTDSLATQRLDETPFDQRGQATEVSFYWEVPQ